MKRNIFLFIAIVLLCCRAGTLCADNNKALIELQQQFVDLKFGMLICFNISTFMNNDWADPDASPSLFNPVKMDCSQWAKAAVSANMTYGCLTTKHHNGFCIWDTKTTPYNVMNSPFGRDVVKEYTDAFRKEGLKTMLYYSILDTHHKLRPGYITREHIEMVKSQLTELLSGYGEIDALIIDGWDAPWARISYEDIPFDEIYRLVKRLQPNCLVTDLNAAKYPAEFLFYTDIKSYEQGAGQHISKESNHLPALSCLPLNTTWFWKSDFPTTPVKDPAVLVKDNLEPFNRSYCNFMLSAAPNRDGLIDDNTLAALKKMGELWNKDGTAYPLPACDAPVISTNIAKHKPVNSSWSNDMSIMDFGNDDNFHTAWHSNPEVDIPWYEIDFPKEETFNAIMVYDPQQSIQRYKIVYEQDGEWKTLFSGENKKRAKIHRFDRIRGSKVKMIIEQFSVPPSVAEFGIYDEWR